jgi:hypothetical protein
MKAPPLNWAASAAFVLPVIKKFTHVKPKWAMA